MSRVQRSVVILHAALAVAFVGYALVIGRFLAEDMARNYVSPARGFEIRLAVTCIASALLVAAGTGIWARTGKRRFALGADLVVEALASTDLLALVWLEPGLYMGLLGLGLVCMLAVAVVPRPRGRANQPA
jgi:hypothetical protein